MEIRPTILTGWNVEFFDIPYLYNQIQVVVGQNVVNVLSPILNVQWSDFGTLSIRYHRGVSTLDYLQLYKNLHLVNVHLIDLINW